MTSSSNIVGDVKQRLKLRKVNSKYFFLKCKKDCGESGGHTNNFKTKLKLREIATVDALTDGKNTHGILRSIKKKLSIKNFYKSKRKIISTEPSSNFLGAGSSNTMKSFNEEAVLLSDENNIVEIKDRISTINLNSSYSSDALIHSSKNRSNQEYPAAENYLNSYVNGNNECNVDDSQENSQNRRINDSDESISSADIHVNDKVCESEEISERESNGDKKYPTNLSQELQKLRKYGWYWGNTSGNVADAALLSEPDGAFLIRDSSDHRHLLTLSFKSAGKLLHARIEHSGGMFSLCNQGESGRFSSVPELIDHSMNFSKYAVFCYSRPRHPGYPAFPVRLTKPVSRFNCVRSLQYLCRFVIRQNTRWDNINKLPLPKSLRIYIEEGHY